MDKKSVKIQLLGKHIENIGNAKIKWDTKLIPVTDADSVIANVGGQDMSLQDAISSGILGGDPDTNTISDLVNQAIADADIPNQVNDAIENSDIDNRIKDAIDAEQIPDKINEAIDGIKHTEYTISSTEDNKWQLNKDGVAVEGSVIEIVYPETKTYSISKLDTAESGYIATYELQDNEGNKVGASINIPKDFLVKSGEIKTVETADQPYSGAQVDDKYIDFVINVKEGSSADEHMYIAVNDLVDAYTEGNGIEISSDNVISIKKNNAEDNAVEITENGIYVKKVENTDTVTTILAGNGIDVAEAENDEHNHTISVDDNYIKSIADSAIDDQLGEDGSITEAINDAIDGIDINQKVKDAIDNENIPQQVADEVASAIDGLDFTDQVNAAVEAKNIPNLVETEVGKINIEDKVNNAISAADIPGQVNEAVEGLDLTDLVNSAVDAKNIPGLVETEVGKIDIDGKVSAAIDNADIPGKVEEEVSKLNLDDYIKVSDVLVNNNTLSIKGVDFTPVDTNTTYTAGENISITGENNAINCTCTAPEVPSFEIIEGTDDDGNKTYTFKYNGNVINVITIPTQVTPPVDPEYEVVETTEYSDINITEFAYENASAAGSELIPHIEYTQTKTITRTNSVTGEVIGTPEVEVLSTGATISYSGENVDTTDGKVIVSSKGTVESPITEFTQAIAIVSMNGKSATANASVLQESNQKTVKVIINDGSMNFDANPISSNTTSANVTYNGLVQEKFTYTSGATTTNNNVTLNWAISEGTITNNNDCNASITVPVNTSSTDKEYVVTLTATAVDDTTQVDSVNGVLIQAGSETLAATPKAFHIKAGNNLTDWKYVFKDKDFYSDMSNYTRANDIFVDNVESPYTFNGMNLSNGNLFALLLPEGQTVTSVIDNVNDGDDLVSTFNVVDENTESTVTRCIVPNVTINGNTYNAYVVVAAAASLRGMNLTFNFN